MIRDRLTDSVFPETEPQFYFLTYAGGCCSVFDCVRSYLPETWRYGGLEYPGRGKRRHIAVQANLLHLLADLDVQLQRQFNARRPLYLIGYELGALLACHLAKGGDSSRRYRVSGVVSLSSAPPDDLTLMPDNRLQRRSFDHSMSIELGKPLSIDRLRSSVDAENFSLLQADLDCYRQFFWPWEKLSCPVLCFGGNKDVFTTPRQLSSWLHVSDQPEKSRIRLLSGSHYCHEQNAARIGHEIVQWLQTLQQADSLTRPGSDRLF